MQRILNFDKYIKTGRWRCLSSPSGAHCWIIGSGKIGECKYCGEKKRFIETQRVFFDERLYDPLMDGKALSECLNMSIAG